MSTEATGIPIKVVEEAIIGNINHLSKTEILYYSCEDKQEGV